jgi:hypothetical protein
MIERELSTAARAARKGNEGMARVCARRAAGVAIAHWLESHPHPAWGTNAMQYLRAVHAEESFPREVRSAAFRLAARVTQNFSSPFSNDPIADSRMIVDFFFT